MVLKFVKTFWFVSMMASLTVLLLVYASLPQQVVILEKESKLVSLSQDAVFYIALGALALINMLVYAIAKISKDEHFRIWFYGLVMTLNLFFIIALSLIKTFNSGEKFNYNQIDLIIYGSVWLMVLWAISWPFYTLGRKFFHKSTV